MPNEIEKLAKETKLRAELDKIINDKSNWVGHSYYDSDNDIYIDERLIDDKKVINEIINFLKNSGYLPVQEVTLEGLTETERINAAYPDALEKNKTKEKLGLWTLHTLERVEQAILSKLQQGGKLYRVKEAQHGS